MHWGRKNFHCGSQNGAKSLLETNRNQLLDRYHKRARGARANLYFPMELLQSLR